MDLSAFHDPRIPPGVAAGVHGPPRNLVNRRRPARYSGLALFTVGIVLRIAPVFVLGRRFSGLVAIQEGHELVTNENCRGPARE